MELCKLGEWDKDAKTLRASASKLQIRQCNAMQVLYRPDLSDGPRPHNLNRFYRLLFQTANIVCSIGNVKFGWLQGNELHHMTTAISADQYISHEVSLLPGSRALKFFARHGSNIAYTQCLNIDRTQR